MNAQCSADSAVTFKNALHINTTAEFGVILEAGAEVLGSNLPIPQLSNLPSFVKDMILLDRCFDLDEVKAGVDGLMTLDVAASTTLSSASLTASTPMVTVSPDKSINAQTITMGSTENQNMPPGASAGASSVQIGAIATMSTSTVIKTVTRTIEETGLMPSSNC